MLDHQKQTAPDSPPAVARSPEDLAVAAPLAELAVPKVRLGADAVRELQYSNVINNLPKGQETETAVFAVADVPRHERLDPRLAERYLEQDRAELRAVASLASARLGREVSPREALQIVCGRMADIMSGAIESYRNSEDSRSNVISLINTLTRSLEIDPQGAIYRIGTAVGFYKTIDVVEDWLKLSYAERREREDAATHIKVGDRVFALWEYSRSPSDAQLKFQEMSATMEKMRSHPVSSEFDKHRQSDGEQFYKLAREVEKLVGLPHEAITLSSSTFDDERYRTDSKGAGLYRIRANHDVLFRFKNAEGLWQDCRLNQIQLTHATRGIFPKWDPNNPPPDEQQRVYPTSPLKFWMDHIAPLTDEKVRRLAQ